ncbi:hypothetical protein AALO_G00235020 [Alosa alosa]|uniref:Male-enhanced antigen 1 n=1 Tax=Alosa alosa TaxID=278164 RepID=A0AAV6FV25_9TELE|nr:hypothetical protein AALO_G00235020 [Alosa alosa]
MDTAERRVQEDGAPGEGKERLKTSLQAFQVRHKPHWVLQRGWGQNNIDDLNMEDTQAVEDIQPTEPASERVNMEDTLAEEDLQPAEPASEKANMEDTLVEENLQPGVPDLQPAEPASCGLWPDVAGNDRARWSCVLQQHAHHILRFWLQLPFPS